MACHTIKKNTNPYLYTGGTWEILQYIGLVTAGVGAIRRQLLFGGYASLQSNDNPYTGRKDLIINQGGLRNKEATSKLKNLFKGKVKPSLRECLPELCKDFNGKIELHFGEGVLQQIDMKVT